MLAHQIMDAYILEKKLLTNLVYQYYNDYCLYTCCRCHHEVSVSFNRNKTLIVDLMHAYQASNKYLNIFLLSACTHVHLPIYVHTYVNNVDFPARRWASYLFIHCRLHSFPFVSNPTALFIPIKDHCFIRARMEMHTSLLTNNQRPIRFTI